jgi:alcohol dehydrogenase
MNDASYEFRMPTKIVAGAGSAAEIGAEVSDLGASRALIVTDSTLRSSTDLVSRVEHSLGTRCAGIYDGVTPDSGINVVDNGAALAAELGADCLVSVGGGSAIDTAKAICVVMARGGSIRDHFAVQALSAPTVPHLAVPTTAGTGSEVTNVALVKDEAARTKFFLLDNHIFPATAVLDPSRTTGLPATLTAATALDAVTHAVEAITSLLKNPVSEAMAVQAIRMVAESLPGALERPDDTDARMGLLAAANLAGAAFSNAMVGLVHAIAHALGGVASVHHGLANSIMLPHVVRYNAETDASTYLAVAAALGIDSVYARASGGAAAEEIAAEVADRLAALASEAGLPTTLSGAGVKREMFPDIAERALSDGAIINNCRPVAGEEEVMQLLEAAL